MSPLDVNIYPGRVTTFAGDGTNATLDGTGTGAEFKDIGGAVVLSGIAYVSTVGAIRKVDLTTAAVTTLAGSATLTGCTDSTDPMQARFSSQMGDLTTDNNYLYVADQGCAGIRKVSVATGATSTIAPSIGIFSVTYGPDGYLYAAGAAYVYKVDPTSGSTTNYYHFDGYHTGIAITSDSQYLWVSTVFNGNCGTQLLRITLADGSVTTYTIPGNCSSITGHSQLASSGGYLYASSGTDTGVERFTKADGTLAQVAGTNAAGYVDGTGTDAWFSKVTGIGSDGTNLWVGDSGNHRFRELVPASRLPAAQSPLATTNFNIYPGKVTTFAGNGTNATLDGTGTAAEFKDMGGVVVIGGVAYVSTAGAIRKVDLTTAAVTTVAGSATLTGCTDSSDPTQARFSQYMGDLTTDGYYLYAVDGGCPGIRRVSLATGATSTLVPSIGPIGITFGPDGYLYTAGGGYVYKVDPVNGTSTPYYTFDANHVGFAASSDSQYLWVGVNWYPNGPCGTLLYRFTLADGSLTTFSIPNCGFVTGHSQLVSAGNYLYASSGADSGVERITKATGAVGSLAGGNSGFVDDVWANAQFSKVTGVASDGMNLWITDSGNHRFREAQFVPLQAQEIGPGSTPDAATPRAMSGDPVDTSNGEFTWSVTDATVPGKGLPFTYTRWYNALAPRVPGRLGLGWTDSFDATLELSSDTSGRATISMPDGQYLTFHQNGSVFTAEKGVMDTLVQGQGPTYVLTQPDGTAYTFNASGVLQSIADRNAHTLLLNYTGSQLMSVTDTAGRTVSFSYAPNTTTMTLQGGRHVTYNLSNGLLTSVNDLGTGSPGTTTYSYTGDFLQQITDQNSQLVVYNTYETYTGRVATQQDTNGTSSYGYGPLTTTVTDNRGKLWTYQYGSTGILASVTDPDNNVTSYSGYDLNHLVATVITRPGNRMWQYNYTFDANNKVTQLTIIPPITADNVTYSYNGFEEVTSYQDGRNNTTRYEYDSAGNLTCVLLPTASVTTCAAAGQQYKYTYGYNADKLLSTVIDPNNHTTSYNYDANGGLCWVLIGTSGNACSSPPSGSTSYTSDPDTGWRLTMVTPRGNTPPNNPANYTWTYSYWPDNLLHTATDPLNHQTSYAYYPTGTLHTVTDANNHVTTYDYYGGGQLQDVVDPLNHKISYTYDANGNVQTVTDQNMNATQYAYWENNQLKTVTDPLNHQWQYSLYNPTTGQITETLPSGGTLTRGYDQMDRVTSITYSNAPTTPNVSFTYDAAGNRQTMVSGSPAFTRTYAYDPNNRLCWAYVGTSSNACSSPPSASFAYLYDPAGNLTRRTYPDGTVTSYGYDDHNRMCYAYVGSTSAACGSAPSGSTIYAYDLVNGKLTKTLPNGFVSTATYDKADRLTSLVNLKTSPALSSFTYTLDNVGNPTVVASVVNGKSETIHYTYNTDDRLQKVCYDSAGNCTGTGLVGISYLYDSAGNITSKQTYGSSPTTTTYRYNADNQLCWAYVGSSGNACASPPGGSTIYTYSANGNETAAGSRTFNYDLANRLISTTSGSTTDTYTYDGDGNRLTDAATGQATNNYTWDTNAPMALLATETPGGTARRYIYGDGPISLKTSASYYYLTDGMGSVANLTDSTGASKWDLTYEPYGAFRSQVGHNSPPTNPMAFDGEYRDSSTTLYDLRARMYDTGTGTLLQADPISSSPSYAFASGQPTVMVDPTGMLSVWGWIGLGLIVVGSAVLGVATGGLSLGVEASVIAGAPAAAGLGSGLVAAGTALVARDMSLALASRFRGGIARDLYGQGSEGIHVHHMPAQSTYAGRPDMDPKCGPGIQMEGDDHTKTASYGSRGAAYRAQQAGLLQEGRLDDAIQMDIEDVTSNFPGKYDNAILQMIDALDQAFKGCGGPTGPAVA